MECSPAAAAPGAPPPADARSMRSPAGSGREGEGAGSAGLIGVVTEAAVRLRRAQSGLVAAAEGRDAVRLGASGSSGASGGAEGGANAAALLRALSSGSATPTSRPTSAAGAAGSGHGPCPDPDSAERGAAARPASARQAAAGGDVGAPRGGAPAAAAFAAGVQGAGEGGPEAAGARTALAGARPPPPPGDVTLATRDAFDTINAMFCGALPGEAPWQAGERWVPAAPPDTGRLPRAALERTVTVSTRAALNALSGMFAGALPHEAPRGRPAERGRAGEAETEAALLPGRAASPEPAARQRTLVVYEDTQFGAGAGDGGGDGGSGAPSPMDSPRPGTGGRYGAGGALGGGGGGAALDIYEDTQFGLDAGAGRVGALRPPAAPPSPALAVYEDTQFVGGAGFGLPARGAPAAGASPPGCPGHDATQFMSENVPPPPPAAAACPRRALFGEVRQPGGAGAPAAGLQSPDTGGREAWALPSAGPAAAAADARAAAGQDALDDQENRPHRAGPAAAPARAGAAAAPGLLRDIRGDAAAAMGIALAADELVESPLRLLRLARAAALPPPGLHMQCRLHACTNYLK